jgi:catechol 2,3-dioxygenase-like lactoylglutathione lyase family enzyme
MITGVAMCAPYDRFADRGTYDPAMAIGASRIYHVNSNCTDLTRAVAFYEALGLVRVTRTVPSRPQPGAAFGLDEVAWDAWMMQGDDGIAGLALDLLEWCVPTPIGTPAPVGAPGFDRLVVTVPDLDRVLGEVQGAGGAVIDGPLLDRVDPASRTATLTDPDGVRVQVVEGDGTRLARVVVTCTDLDRAFAYYRDVMGLRTDGEPVTVDTSVRRARLEDSGSTFAVELVEWIDPPPGASDAHVRAANELGLFRMAWSTDDCARDEAVLRASGSVPFAPTGTLSVGDDLPRLQVLFWAGPSGECLELIQVTTESGVLSP